MEATIQITTTTSTRAEAEAIARRLLETRLVACAQVGGPITSFYRWEGVQEQAEEWKCEAKTSTRLLPQIEALLDDEHRYDLPQLVAVPIVGGSQSYLDWLKSELGEGGL